MTKRVALVALTLIALTALPASGGGQSTPINFYLEEHHISNPVDYLTWCGDCGGVDYTTGAPWVVNPTNCLWDSDDAYRYHSWGNVLGAGKSVSISECLYARADNGPFLPTDIWIQSASENLVITTTWSWDGGSVATRSVPRLTQKSVWLYEDCILSPPAQGGIEVVIPNSNGGRSVPVQITVTISNPTNKNVMKTGGVIESGRFWNSCPNGYRSP